MKLVRIRGLRRSCGVGLTPISAFKHLCLAVAATAVLALAVGSCSSSRPPTAPPPGTQDIAVVRVELIAPQTIAPGESVQLTANVVRAVGPVENVTAQARWTSSDRSVIEINSTGLATGVRRGEAFLSVSYESRQASANTFVLPTGTYRLGGTVSESGIRLPGVSVAVIDAVGDDLTTTTDANGTYVLYGVSGRVRLRAEGFGYFDEIQEIDVVGHRTFDIELRIERERTDARGRYRLTIERSNSRSSSCTAFGLPETRAYDATVEQDGARLTVTLSGAPFVTNEGRGNGFTGTVDARNRVAFAIGDPDEYYYTYREHELVERISDTRALIISGYVTAAVSATGISGMLNGVFLLAEGAGVGRIVLICAGAHPFEMVRQ